MAQRSKAILVGVIPNRNTPLKEVKGLALMESKLLAYMLCVNIPTIETVMQ